MQTRNQLTHVCMICRQIIAAGRPSGRYPINPSADTLSHGLCCNCASGYCLDLGLAPKAIEAILDTYTAHSTVS